MAEPTHEQFGSFQTTRWSMVRLARHIDPEIRRDALGRLVEGFSPALRAHLVLRRRLPADLAEDYLQGFICDKIIERELLDRADPSKGRLRSLLVKSLDNYVNSKLAKHSLRSPTLTDFTTEDASYDPSSPVTPASPDVFDIAWARWVLAESIERMRADCNKAGRQRIWDLFESRILLPTLSDVAPLPYAEVVRQFGFASPEEASNTLMTAKRHFTRTLRSVVTESVENEDEIDGEIAELRDVLAHADLADVTLMSLRTASLPADTLAASANIDSTSPHALATIFAVETDRDSLWSDDELRAVLDHQLSIPLPSAFGPPERHVAQTLARCGAPLTSFAELIGHPQPPVEILRAVKRAARGAARREASSLPTEIASVLYFASIALALVRLGERISRSDDELLRQGFEANLNRPWVDERLTALFHSAVAKLATI